jgi:hypothetical protein
MPLAADSTSWSGRGHPNLLGSFAREWALAWIRALLFPVLRITRLEAPPVEDVTWRV